jgi:hypothetical protein
MAALLVYCLDVLYLYELGAMQLNQMDSAELFDMSA